ncbi:putative TRAM/LAG1/CLN8 domain-containing protein [Lupinus albus]|uniref:Putative TRAM/LAG1/CLN8 domain-containing protein n=1 Tax=Lupinus albus TaxID=3870 RepID=A0A6A4N9C6_LUPAL|nr:putative TRAM/LAG1/CLN8 domain-containing protein [Lupinus albus]
MRMEILQFEFPNMILLPFFIIFLSIYLFSYFIIFRNWNPNLRLESSSCLISLFHGTPAVILGCAAVFSNPNRGFDAVNTVFDKIVLDYSTAYFLMDLVHYLVFFPGDVLFIAHHLATLFVIVTCRHAVSHGAFAVIVLLVLAEVTSACQNAWTLAAARRMENRFAAKVYDALSLPFFALYSIVRGFVGPYFMYRMIVFYVRGGADGLLPRWIWVSWVVVVVMAIGVSIMWITNLWLQHYRERTRRLEEKIR